MVARLVGLNLVERGLLANWAHVAQDALFRPASASSWLAVVGPLRRTPVDVLRAPVASGIRASEPCLARGLRLCSADGIDAWSLAISTSTDVVACSTSS